MFPRNINQDEGRRGAAGGRRGRVRAVRLLVSRAAALLLAARLALSHAHRASALRGHD